MNLTNLLGARLGLEEISEDLSPDYNPADVSDTSMLEMEKAHEEVVSTEADMAMLSDTTDSLERIAAVLECITTPTLSTESAMLINLAFENTMHPMAKYSDNKYSSAMRGGDDTEGQKKGFMQKLKEAWAAFVLMLKKVWDAITNFISRLFSSAGSLKRKAEAILKKARVIRDNPKAPQFSMNVNEIQIDGKVAKPADIVKVTKDAGEIYHNLLVGKDSLLNKTFVTHMKKAIEDIAKPLDKDATMDSAGDKQEGLLAKKDIDNLRSVIKDHTAKVAIAAGIGKDPGATLSKTLGDGLLIKISKDTLPGDRVMVFGIMDGKDLDSSNHEDFVKYIKSVNYDIVSNREDTLERTEVEPLPIKGIADTLSVVINTCIDVEAFNKEWFTWLKSYAELQTSLFVQMNVYVDSIYLTAAEQKQAQENKETGANQLDAIKAIRSIIMAMLTLTQKFGSFEGKVAKQAMRSCHGLINYAGRSLNAHIGNPNDDFEAGPNATKNSKGYQEHERSTPGSKGFTNNRDDISDADLVV